MQSTVEILTSQILGFLADQSIKTRNELLSQFFSKSKPESKNAQKTKRLQQQQMRSEDELISQILRLFTKVLSNSKSNKSGSILFLSKHSRFGQTFFP